jgi:hypothetical protein
MRDSTAGSDLFRLGRRDEATVLSSTHTTRLSSPRPQHSIHSAHHAQRLLYPAPPSFNKHTDAPRISPLLPRPPLDPLLAPT